MAMGNHLRRHGWSGGPSMAAILGPGGSSTATYSVADGPGDLFWGDLFWGDYLWHDSSYASVYEVTVHEAVFQIFQSVFRVVEYFTLTWSWYGSYRNILPQSKSQTTMAILSDGTNAHESA